MNEGRETVLIGDGNEARSQMLCEVLEREFRRFARVVTNYDALVAAAKEFERQKKGWGLVLVATDLQISASNSFSIETRHFHNLKIVSSVDRIDYIFSQPADSEQSNWETESAEIPGSPADRVIPERITTDDEYKQVTQFLKTVGRWKREPEPPEIHLAFDPILREQVRALDRERDLEKGKKLLSYLIRNLNLAPRIEHIAIAKVGQGRSGAKVFRIRPRAAGAAKHDYLIKLSYYEDSWKLVSEIAGHIQAQASLGKPGYGQYVANLWDLDRNKSVTAMKKVDDPARYMVAYGNWYAICYDFLGGKGFGHFLDLEKSVAADFSRFSFRTWEGSGFKPKSNAPTDVYKTRLKLLHTMLEKLCDAWYGNADLAQRLRRPVWQAADREAKVYPQMPPYQLSGQTKSRILNFLASRDAEIGRYFFDQWHNRIQFIRRFLEWTAGSPIPGVLGRELNVVVSPVHGDLNANNILLWLKEARPFLIDFPWYQNAGHALQDLASLEFSLKFFLMDRQELNVPEHPLPAMDHSPSQLPLWAKLENQLLSKNKLGKPGKLESSPCHIENVALCWELLRRIRNAAVDVQNKPYGDKDTPKFFEEYLPSLLFYTIRAIGYDLPLPKRLLAIYSTSEILNKLKFSQAGRQCA